VKSLLIIGEKARVNDHGLRGKRISEENNRLGEKRIFEER
jgi:hypothetical protein